MIVHKSRDEIELMRRAGRVVARALVAAVEHVRAGVTTAELDRVVEKVVTSSGCVPSFKGYNGFPASVCVSVNDEILHGIPGARRLRDSDVVTIDVGAAYRGYHADSATTVCVGEPVPAEVERLLQATRDALWAGVGSARPGARLGDISSAVQRVVEAAGFAVVAGYTGHGVGRELHEDPDVPNAGRPGRGPVLREGMTLAVEPMVSAGSERSRVLADGWTVVTADGGLAAHFEHSIALTAEGVEVLTECA